MTQAQIDMVMSQLAAMATPGRMTEISFYHDDWCPCHRGYLPLTSCTCRPYVEIRAVKYTIADSGQLQRTLS